MNFESSTINVDSSALSSLPGHGENKFLFIWGPKEQWVNFAFPSSLQGLIKYTF